MSIKMQPFKFKNIDVMSFIIDEDFENPFFLGNNVAECLGYSKANYSHALSKHTDPDDRRPLKYCDSSDLDESNICAIWEGNDRRDKTLINESGLYCLIFGSHADGAKEFKLWVTKEVLPSIRKHGGYINRQEELAPEDQEDLYKEIETLSQKVAKLADKNEKLTEQNTRLKKRWHAAVSDRNVLKGQKTELKKTNKKLSVSNRKLIKDACESDEIISKLRNKYDSWEKTLKEVVEPAYNRFREKYPDHVFEKEPVKAAPKMKTTVDIKTGLLVSCC